MLELQKNSKGFTLIEVLIAGVILIISVSAMTLIYRTAVLSSQKASNNVKLSGSVSAIILTIQNQIRSAHATSPMTGEGELDGVKYTWSSTLNEKKGAPQRFNPDEGRWLEQPERFYLWDVHLSVSNNTLIKDLKYLEVSWSKS